MRGTKHLVDGSLLIVEALTRAGADVYIGYPITPANLIYEYARRRFPEFYAAPDEISALQWAAGYAATGKLPVAATSFPGLALMVESVNMFYMMELPLVLVLVQRLGPSTGSATVGAEGDLLLLRGILSGGYTLPVFCPADLTDCWTLSAAALEAAANMRSPVILMTSKEMVMTSCSLDLTELPPISPVKGFASAVERYSEPYAADENDVPPFLPVGNSLRRVRLNASTHDRSGLIRDNTPESLVNTQRLQRKILHHMKNYEYFVWDAQNGSDLLLISYGVSALSTRAAAEELRRRGIGVDLLTLQTLLPVPQDVIDGLDHYRKIIVVEENITGALCRVLFGLSNDARIVSIGSIGRPISPSQIIREAGL